MRKVRTSRCHLLAEKRGNTSYFLWIKIFCLSRWTFESSVFREISQNFSSFRKLLSPVENVNWMFVWMSLSYICWNFQLSIFIHKEIWSVPTIDSSVIDLFTAHNKTYIKCDSNIQPKAFWNWKAVPKNLFSFEEFKWMNSCKFVINTC